MRKNTSKEQLQHRLEYDFAYEIKSKPSYLWRVVWSVVQGRSDLEMNSMNLSSKLKNTFDVNYKRVTIRGDIMF